MLNKADLTLTYKLLTESSTTITGKSTKTSWPHFSYSKTWKNNFYTFSYKEIQNHKTLWFYKKKDWQILVKYSDIKSVWMIPTIKLYLKKSYQIEKKTSSTKNKNKFERNRDLNYTFTHSFSH